MSVAEAAGAILVAAGWHHDKDGSYVGSPLLRVGRIRVKLPDDMGQIAIAEFTTTGTLDNVRDRNDADDLFSDSEQGPSGTFSIPFRDLIEEVLGLRAYLNSELPALVTQGLHGCTVPPRRIIQTPAHIVDIRGNGDMSGSVQGLSRSLEDLIHGHLVAMSECDLFVIGAGGSGKSTGLLSAVSRILSASGPPPHQASRLVPLIVPGTSLLTTRVHSKVAYWRTLAGLLGSIPTAQKSAVRALLRQYFHFALVVDGVDEVPSQLGLDAVKEILESLNETLEPATRIFLGRPAYAGTPSEALSRILGVAPRQCAMLVEAGAMPEPDAHQIFQDYAHGDEATTLLRHMLSRLSDLARVPLLAQASALVTSQHPNEFAESSHAIVPRIGSILKGVAKLVLRRESIEKHRNGLPIAVKEEFLAVLAGASFIHARGHGIGDVGEEDFVVAAGSIGTPSTGWAHVVPDISTSPLVVCELRGNASTTVRFASTAFRDLYIAHFIKAELDSCGDRRASIYNVLGAHPFWALGVRPWLVSSCLEDAYGLAPAEEALLDALKTTRQPQFRKFTPHRFLGANLLRLLVALKRQVGRTTLSSLQIPGTDLSGFKIDSHTSWSETPSLVFDKCDLRLCNFSGADLRNIRFRSCRLERSNFAFCLIDTRCLDDLFDSGCTLTDSIGWDSFRDTAGSQLELVSLPSSPTARPSWLGDWWSGRTRDVLARFVPGRRENGRWLCVQPDRLRIPECPRLKEDQVFVDAFFARRDLVTNREVQSHLQATGTSASDVRTATANPYALLYFEHQELVGRPPRLEAPTPDDPAVWIPYVTARNLAGSGHHRLISDAEWHLLDSLLKDEPSTTRPGDAAREWVLDSDIGQPRLSYSHAYGLSGSASEEFLNHVNPCHEETGTPPAGRLDYGRTLGQRSSRRRILRTFAGTSARDPAGAGCGCGRVSIFESAVNHDVGVRLAVDWFFVDALGHVHSSTETVIEVMDHLDRIATRNQKEPMS